ncbi:MAG: putative Na+/H+ antiporter [Betaproteobacteria bacterium]
MNPTTVQIVAAIIFAVAVLHTFSGKFFEKLAHRHPAHAGIFHLLGEVEAVFGFWALILIAFIALAAGPQNALEYLNSRNFTEPLFVFVIMVIAASRPILKVSLGCVDVVAKMLPMHRQVATFFVALSLLPLLGSFITEPAAMTLAALLLRERFYNPGLSNRLKYLTLGVLFVNVSICGTLTPYAAPPVLMVAATWDWDLMFMITNFGWRSALAVTINALVLTLIFRSELSRIPIIDKKDQEDRIPIALTATHILFLVAVVVAAHHAVVFMGLFLFFLGIVTAYNRWQDRLILREGMMVGFFLAGLVVLGGQQQWWLQPALSAMSPTAVYYGATALTAITDNAALTYLGSLVEGLSDEFKLSLVAGAVTGGGLTVIANAPNPAGYSILKSRFDEEEISAGGLFLAALVPTLVAVAAFRLI